MNPHAIPSRMTIGHLLELLAGKVVSYSGKIMYADAFNSPTREELEQMLINSGWRYDGRETFYDGMTGKRIEGTIFTGVIGHYKLYHMVRNKVQARARGPVQILTRQPTEGKAKGGGLKIGEMEMQAFVGHGASMVVEERMSMGPDRIIEYVCPDCGVFAIDNRKTNKRYCPICKNTNVVPVQISYAFKLLLNELSALGILPRIKVK